MALRNRGKKIREDADKGLASINEESGELEKEFREGVALGRNRERLKEAEGKGGKSETPQNDPNHTQGTTKKTKAIRKKSKKDDPTISALRAVLGELSSDIKPKHLKFLLEYVNNGFIGWRAYKTIYPHVKKNTAKAQAGQWLKGISMSDMLWLCGFGYERIIEDLERLSPERRMHYLMKLHKLDHKQVEHTGKMEIQVLPPPVSNGTTGKRKGKEGQEDTVVIPPGKFLSSEESVDGREKK